MTNLTEISAGGYQPALLGTAAATAAALVVQPVVDKVIDWVAAYASRHFDGLPTGGQYNPQDFEAGRTRDEPLQVHTRARRDADGVAAVRTPPDYSQLAIRLRNGTDIPFGNLGSMSLAEVAGIVCDLAKQPPDVAGAPASYAYWHRTGREMVTYLTGIGHTGTAQALRHVINALHPFVEGTWKVVADVLQHRPDLSPGQLHGLAQQTFNAACQAAQALPVKYGQKGRAIYNELQFKTFAEKWVPSRFSLISAADQANNAKVIPAKVATLKKLLWDYHSKIVGALNLNSPSTADRENVHRDDTTHLLRNGRLIFEGSDQELMELLSMMPTTDLDAHEFPTYLKDRSLGISTIYHRTSSGDKLIQAARREGVAVFRWLTDNKWSRWTALHRPSTPELSDAMANVFKDWYTAQWKVFNQVLRKQTPDISG